MYKEILQAIAGVEIFPVISLLLFVTVFGTVLYWTFRVDRTRLSEFSQMPLDDATLAHAPEAQADAHVKGVAQ
jgi:hypothetical protein